MFLLHCFFLAPPPPPLKNMPPSLLISSLGVGGVGGVGQGGIVEDKIFLRGLDYRGRQNGGSTVCGLRVGSVWPNSCSLPHYCTKKHNTPRPRPVPLSGAVLTQTSIVKPISCQVHQVKTLRARVRIGACATFNGPETKLQRSKEGAVNQRPSGGAFPRLRQPAAATPSAILDLSALLMAWL